MIDVKQLHVVAGEFSITQVNFSIEKGCCGVLMGKSGCGKTTIMEAICGLREVRGGDIFIESRNVTHLQPRDRMVGLVPQDNVLFSTMTVREHIQFALKLRKWTGIDARVNEVADELGIAHLLDRLPKGLSGGEAKRVAIARAIAPKPDLLCLDESFTGLDDDTRHDVMQVVKNVISHEGVTTLLITHSQGEANFLGDVQYRVEDIGVKGACPRRSAFPMSEPSSPDGGDLD